MAEPPSGTVTFLSTDIEGSTGLLQELGDDYTGVLTNHRALLRSIFAAHSGYEVDTQGDAFLVAFARAREAVAAAAEVQMATAQDDIRVRIAIHSAEAIFTGEGYVGLGVHRAARLCAVAHGGQILLSQTTRELLLETPFEGVELRDLGEHRLKDLARAQRVYELVVPGLDAKFPSLRSLGNRPTNLPVQPTPLIGREREIREVTGLLRQGDIRLVTLTGPAGTGKTRLAVQAAAELLDDFRDGTYFIGLAAVADPDLVLPTVARTLGVREGTGRLLVDAVHEYVRERELLLVFDNFEHLVSRAGTVSELVAHATRLKVLATSRGALHLAAEHVYLVPPLETPAGNLDVERLLNVESVALFVARGRAARPDFALTTENARAVAGICTTLDGLPLAIELAAARLGALPPAALLARLDDRFKLLTGGPRDSPARHQALRAAIGWSYDLLEPGERALFARLSVFAGTCSLEAAEHVLAADALDGLTSLIDKSLLRLEGTDEKPRYRMLRTIREYAVERLRDAGEERLVRDRHLEYYLQLAEKTYPEWLSRPHEAAAELTPELDNLRVAADWAAEGDAEIHLRLIGALAWFWIFHIRIAEAQERLSAALARATARSAAWARANSFVAEAMFEVGRGEQTLPLYQESLAVWRELGEMTEVALSLEGVGWGYFSRGDDALAQQYFEESLELRRELGDANLVRRSLGCLCQVLVSRGHVDAAEPIAQDLYRRATEAADLVSQQGALHYLADCPLIRGEYATAAERYARASNFALEWRNRMQCATELSGLAMALSGLGDYERALRLAAAATAEHDRERERRGVVLVIPFWSRLLEKHLGRAREALGPMAAAAAEAEGHDLSLERVLEELRETKTESGPLSRRETQVARLVARGMTNRQIAVNLFLSERTIEGHVDRIRNKLGFRSRTEIAAWAAERGRLEKEGEGPITDGPPATAKHRN